jgi:hypothetical protein
LHPRIPQSGVFTYARFHLFFKEAAKIGQDIGFCPPFCRKITGLLFISRGLPKLDLEVLPLVFNQDALFRYALLSKLVQKSALFSGILGHMVFLQCKNSP